MAPLVSAPLDACRIDRAELGLAAMTQRDADIMEGHSIGRCTECGKFLYRTRTDARKASRKALGAGHMTVYPCPHRDGYWHYGHMPAAVKNGTIDKDRYEANTRSRQIRISAQYVGAPVTVTLTDPRDAAVLVDALDAAAHAFDVTGQPKLSAKYRRLCERFADALDKAAVPPCNDGR